MGNPDPRKQIRRQVVLGIVDALMIADDVLNAYDQQYQAERGPGGGSGDHDFKDRLMLASIVVGLSQGTQMPRGGPKVDPDFERSLDKAVQARAVDEFKTAAVRHGTDARMVDRMVGLLTTLKEGRSLVKLMAFKFHSEDGDQLI